MRSFRAGRGRAGRAANRRVVTGAWGGFGFDVAVDVAGLEQCGRRRVAPSGGGGCGRSESEQEAERLVDGA
jgi:hypothetical protein